MTAAIIALIIAQIADAYTTNRGLETNPRAYETNGFIGGIIARCGRCWIIIKSFGSAVAIGLGLFAESAAPGYNIGTLAVWLWAGWMVSLAIKNAKLIR